MIVLHRELKISKTCIHETHHLIILRDEASPYELSCALVSHLTQPYTYGPSIDCPAPELWYQGMRPAHHDWGAQRNGNYHGRSMEGKIKGAPNSFKKYQKIIGNCLIVDISIIQFEGGKASCLNKYKWRNCARLWFLAFPMFFLHGFWTQCVEKSGNIWRFCLWGSLCWSEYIRLPNISYHIHLGLRRFKIRSIKSGSFFG